MGLDVGVFGTEERLRSAAGEFFHDVDVPAASVVAASGVPFRILVRENRPHGFEDGEGDEVLRSDELEAVFLAAELGYDGLKDFGVAGAHVIQRRHRVHLRYSG